MGAGGGGDRQHQQQDGGADADLYAVLGLSRECTDAELRVAYRKLAMIWHPDRCSAAGSSSTGVDEAKERFQEIQGAYSVLSDSNKRFLYDVGVYDGGNDDEADLSGMGDFLGEMAQMMSQATPTVRKKETCCHKICIDCALRFMFWFCENRKFLVEQESFEELQQLFVDMFQDDIDAGFCQSAACTSQSPPSWPLPSSPPPATTDAQAPASRKGVNKRCSPTMDSSLGLGISGFCFKVTSGYLSWQVPSANQSVWSLR
ncbi:hypothetical protein E2562_029926 [Oryza meyeriana var. granulata]|uniref:J domain-containing protein n=1 Tax=Oryza meyeriana var. granulata TaxID=110450 RepID=A0A6G1CVA3_9ORYZ|nr:hypothetical protein E2562_029926 [Oryza meyeriana var. granulata]